MKRTLSEKIFFWVAFLSLLVFLVLSFYLFALLFRGDLGGIIGFVVLTSFLVVPAGLFFFSIFLYSFIWFFRERKQAVTYSRRILFLFLGVVVCSVLALTKYFAVGF